MATFTNLENAHTFSKAVIYPTMTANVAGNKSAHTVQSKDIWAEKLPFLNESDLKNITSDTEFSIENHAKVKFHYKKDVYSLVESNNNGISSNGFTAKVIIDNNISIDQFVDPTDVVDETGNMCTVYQAILYGPNGKAVATSDYIINSANGLIYDIKNTGIAGMFSTENKDGKTEYKISFFTYEGTKVSDTLSETDSILADHIANTDIHITDAERTEWDTHVDNTIIHVLETDKVRWNDASKKIDAHDANTVIHVEQDDKDKWNGYESTIDGHINDTVIHVTQDNKDDWNKVIKDLADHIEVKDPNIHVTGDDRTKWDAADIAIDNHIKDDDPHVKPSDKETWNTTSSNLKSHIENTALHLQPGERDSWNGAIKTANSALQSVAGGNDYITGSKDSTTGIISLNVDTSIEDTSKLVPTSPAVKAYVDAKNEELIPDYTRNLWNSGIDSIPGIYSTDNILAYFIGSGFIWTNLPAYIKTTNIEICVADSWDNTLKSYNLGELTARGTIASGVCKVVVADEEDNDIATSNYNTYSDGVFNFSFNKPLKLGKGKTYKFYLYDKNNNFYVLPILANVAAGNSIIDQSYFASGIINKRDEWSNCWGIGINDEWAVYGLRVAIKDDPSGGVNSLTGVEPDNYHDKSSNYLKFNITEESKNDIKYTLAVANDTAFQYQRYNPSGDYLKNKLVSAPYVWNHVNNTDVHLSSGNVYIPGYNYSGMFKSPGVSGYGFEFKVPTAIRIDKVEVQLAFSDSSVTIKNSELRFENTYGPNLCVMKIYDKINNALIGVSSGNTHTPGPAGTTADNGSYTFSFTNNVNLMKGREYAFKIYKLEKDAEGNPLTDENGNLVADQLYSIPFVYHTYYDPNPLENYIHEVIINAEGDTAVYNDGRVWPGAASLTYINGLRTKITGFNIQGSSFDFVYNLVSDSFEYSDYLITLVQNLYNQVNMLSAALVNLQNQNKENNN